MKLNQTKNETWKQVIRNRDIYIILLPTILYFLIFKYVPMFGNVIAFQDYSITKGIWKSEFVGLENFKDFLSDYYFFRLLRNTLSINILNLIFSFPLPIIFAILINEIKNMRFKKAVQTITYMPHFISTVVVCSMVLTFVSSNGMLNSIRSLMGLEKISFMTNPSYFYPVYIISGIWQSFGWSSIIYVASMASIDQELYEAASIDGAGRFQKMMSITLPCLLPTIMIQLILNIGKMLSIGFEKVMLLYNPSIYETADVISTYVYRKGLLEGEFGFSTAVSMFNSIINFILVVTSNKISKKLSGSSLW